MSDEIRGGLKNAMERGASLESAIQSFINAGYNADDVTNAARSLSQGVMTMLNNPNTEKLPIIMQQKQPQQTQRTQQLSTQVTQPTQQTMQQPAQQIQQIQQLPKLQDTMQSEKKPTKKKTIWIILLIALLVFVGALIVLTIYQDEVLALLKVK